MRKQFKQWLPKIRINKLWVIGVIATPIFLWILWRLLLPLDHRLQPDGGHLSRNEREILARQHRTSLTRGVGIFTMVTGGVFLFLNSCIATRNLETADLSNADLSGIDLSGIDLSGIDLSSANLNCANLSGVNLSGVNLSGVDLVSTDLSGADLSGANLRYANLSGANLRYANLRYANLRYANLSGADLSCTLLSNANFSDTNLSEALLFFINLRSVLNLEPLQLKAKPSPFLCNVALPYYAKQTKLNPNRACGHIPYLLSDRYNIPLEEAQEIVNEARQHHWD